MGEDRTIPHRIARLIAIVVCLGMLFSWAPQTSGSFPALPSPEAQVGNETPAANSLPVLDTDAIARCAVTTYAVGQPPNANARTFTRVWYANDALWAGPSPSYGGRWFAGPDGMKVLWVRVALGTLTVEGRRLDDASPPLEAHVPSGYGSGGYQASGLTFPTEGCWEVIGRVGEHSLRIVVYVLPAAYRPDLTHQPAPIAPDLLAGLARPLDPTVGHCYWALYDWIVIPNGAQPVALAEARPGPVHVAGQSDPESGSVKAELSMTIESGYLDALLLRASFGEADGILRFAEESGPTDSTFFPPEGAPFPIDTESESAPNRMLTVDVEVNVPGCYTLQVDGWDFSQAIDVWIGPKG